MLFHVDKWGLSSQATERFDFVARETQGHTLDIGCGYHNRFVNEFLGGHGVGIDVYQYDGLTEDQIVEDMTHLPFNDAIFDTVTFIANINHVPVQDRDAELAEAYRVLKPGGNIIITMGNPLAEIVVHKVVWLYDKLFGTNVDMDTERGMEEGEEYYLTDKEIITRMKQAGFQSIVKKFFWTQWFLNHLFVGWKR